MKWIWCSRYIKLNIHVRINVTKIFYSVHTIREHNEIFNRAIKHSIAVLFIMNQQVVIYASVSNKSVTQLMHRVHMYCSRIVDSVRKIKPHGVRRKKKEDWMHRRFLVSPNLPQSYIIFCWKPLEYAIYIFIYRILHHRVTLYFNLIESVHILLFSCIIINWN